MIQEISKSEIKLIASLRSRKERREAGLMVVEGEKSVVDTLPHFTLRMLVATHDWLSRHEMSLSGEVRKASAEAMRRMSSLSTAPQVLALYELPESHVPAPDELRGALTLLLDGVQDPGNLGTIVRCADWFGIRNIVASPDTVDIYNAKAIQATMGALCRVNVCYTPLPEFIAGAGVPLYGTLLDGDNIYDAELPAEALIVMGNEGKGVSESVKMLIGKRLFIPPFPAGVATVDSLNVAMATAIVIAEFRRRASASPHA